MLEAHMGVPMAHAVLCPINTRLDAPTVRFILGHSRAKVLLLDREFAAVATAALDGVANPPRVVVVDDPEGPGGAAIEATPEEALEQQLVRSPWTTRRAACPYFSLTISFTLDSLIGCLPFPISTLLLEQHSS